MDKGRYEIIYRRKDKPRNNKTIREWADFKYYTPITASYADVYEKIRNKGLLMKPMPLDQVKPKDKSKYCKLHEQNSHTIDDCIILKIYIKKEIHKEI